MSESRFFPFFRRVTQLALTPLAACSLFMMRAAVRCRLSPSLALTLYPLFPRMFEYILSSLIFYLVFSVAVTKIQRDALHDGE